MSRIRELRQARFLTQEALAKAAGTTLPYIGFIERTAYMPGPDLRHRIAGVLGVPETEIWPDRDAES